MSSGLESCCWGVKFQFRGLDFFSKNDEMGSTLIREELEKSNLRIENISELISYSKLKNIKIGFSFFSIRDLEFFKSNNNWSLDFIKIPSSEFRNIKLINFAKKHSEIVMVSYGGGGESEIQDCIVKSQFRDTDVIFHCISNYPVSIGNQQLDFLNRINNNTMAQKGYSSHDENWEVNLIAASYGISFIERHLCESKNDVGLDITTSSDPEELRKLVNLTSNFQRIIRCDERIPNQGEILNVRNLGTSLYASSDLTEGTEISSLNLIERSPAVGLSLTDFTNLKSKVLVKPLKKGAPILNHHFIKTDSSVSKEYSSFANKNRFSLPVRLHDFTQIAEKFNLNNYELHFSYKEIKFLVDKGLEDLLLKINKSYKISIHLPDYISKDELINPLSKNKNVRNQSKKIIDFCVFLARQIELKTKKQCLIVGSFSMNEYEEREEFYLNFKKYVSDIESSSGILILAQWLPKMAWYFGGSVEVDLFSSGDDIEMCKKFKVQICLDIAHLILSANYYKEDWKVWYNRLIHLTKHIHLSDAVGIDGEGVPFGQGDLHSINEIIQHSSIKVLEIWEGHLNDGEKFLDALEYLYTISEKQL
jgi:N-acetylneuraminate synthase